MFLIVGFHKLRSVFLGPPPPKEVDQDGSAGLFENPCDDLGMMIDPRMVENVERAPSSAFGIGEPPNDRADAREDNGTGAHRAGFLGDIEPRAGQTPTSLRLEGRGERKH